MLVYIEGGNRQSGYESELVVRGVAKDLDVAEGGQEVGISKSWRCEDLINGNQPCKNIKSEVLELNQSVLVQSFQPKLLQPYSTLKFYLDAAKSTNSKAKTDSALIIIIELSI